MKVKLSILALSLLAVGCKDDNSNIQDDIKEELILEEFNAADRVKVQTTTDFIPLSSEEWTEKEVTKVLNTFVYGAKTSLTQIKIWADMQPEEAIEQMLSLNAINKYMNPYEDNIISEDDSMVSLHTKLWKYYNDKGHWASGIFQVDSVFEKGEIYSALITEKTSYNPFKLKLGLWETNYHLVINSSIDTMKKYNYWEYFDQIVEGIKAEENYEDIMARCASSTPILHMYKQLSNKYINGELFVNDDFAREINQLFFGILGKDDLSYYEDITVEGTGTILTGMKEERRNISDESGSSNMPKQYVTPTSEHFSDYIEIMHTLLKTDDIISGLQQFADIAIINEESINTLPLMIIKGLADDNAEANEYKKQTIINAWKNMENKNLLQFIKKYAVSRSFHSNDRYRTLSSLDRNIKILNLLNFEGKVPVTPMELKYGATGLDVENYQINTPAKGVFGNLTGADIKNNSFIYSVFYNKAANNNYANIYRDMDFTKLIDKDVKNNTKDISEYLWNKFIGDNLKNYNIIARLQLYTLLVYGNDYQTQFGVSADINEEDILAYNQIIKNYNNMEKETLNLSEDNIKRNIKYATEFILAMPYMWYEEGI